MNTTTKIAIAVAAVVLGVLAFTFVPGLKGPFNRAVITANEKLSDEYVVDNYKTEAISLVAKRRDIVANIRRFEAELGVAEKKLDYAEAKEEAAKAKLLGTGTDDLVMFNRMKEAYELCKTETQNITVLLNVYSSAIEKLNDALSIVDNNISRCKLNVATLQSKKVMADSLKFVNSTIENLSGVGDDHNLDTSLERLDDTILTESIKIEAMGMNTAVGTREAANAYIESIRDGIGE